MITIILVIHVLIAVTMIGLILLQKSEGGALGIGGGGGGGLMTGRGAANLLTRATAVLAALFFVTSIGLAFLSGGQREQRSILDQPASEAPAEPAKPSGPAVPLSE